MRTRELDRILQEEVQLRAQLGLPAESGTHRTGNVHDLNAWLTRLEWKNSKKEAVLRPVAANIEVFLTHHPHWAGRIRYNEFTTRVELDGERWSEEISTSMRIWFQRKENSIRAGQIGFALPTEFTKQDIDCVAGLVGKRRSYHPVREYLIPLKWDGRERVRGLWVNYFGVTDSEYARGSAEMWMKSACKRALEPGSKVDYVPLLIGEQGLKKSQGIAALCPDSSWFRDDRIDLSTPKTMGECLEGKWIVAAEELDTYSPFEMTKLKSVLTSTASHYRGAYGHAADDHPRQAVFIGTSNDPTPLRDLTGNRRYWPQDVGRVHYEHIAQDRDQLWAEALHLLRLSPRYWPEDSWEEDARSRQSEKTERSVWSKLIYDYLRARVGGDVHMEEILGHALNIDKARWEDNRRLAQKIGYILKSMGWTREGWNHPYRLTDAQKWQEASILKTRA